nr:unnamed protein product [Callosobruchus analis]
MIRYEASGLINHKKQFKFICSVAIWYKILSRVNPISKVLQAKAILKQSKELLQNLRSDNCFEDERLEASELASEVDVEPNFEAAR